MNLSELSLRDRWLTLAEAGKVLGIDPRTLERLIEARGVPVIQLERGIRVTLKDLDLLKKPLKDLSLASTFELGPLPDLLLDEDTGSLEEETSPEKAKVLTITGEDAVTRTVSSLLVGKMLSENNRKVCVVDLDFRNGVLGFMTGVSKPTMVSLSIDGIHEESISKTAIHSVPLGLDMFLAPKRPRNAEKFPVNFVRDLVAGPSGIYDYIILCSPAYSIANDEKPAYELADYLLYMIGPVVSSVFGMTRWIQEVTKAESTGGMGIAPEKVGIVVVNAQRDVNMSSEKIERSALGLPIISAIPTEQSQLYGAVNRQKVEAILENPEVEKTYRRIVSAIKP